MEKWSDLEFWTQHFGHRLVPIEVGRHHDKEKAKVAAMAIYSGKKGCVLLETSCNNIFCRAIFVPTCAAKNVAATAAWKKGSGRHSFETSLTTTIIYCRLLSAAHPI